MPPPWPGPLPGVLVVPLLDVEGVVAAAPLEEDGVVRGSPESKARQHPVFERLEKESLTVSLPGDRSAASAGLFDTRARDGEMRNVGSPTIGATRGMTCGAASPRDSGRTLNEKARPRLGGAGRVGAAATVVAGHHDRVSVRHERLRGRLRRLLRVDDERASRNGRQARDGCPPTLAGQGARPQAALTSSGLSPAGHRVRTRTFPGKGYHHKVRPARGQHD